MERDLGWRTHNTVYRWWVVELCTWNLCHFVNQCHPDKFNKKEKIIEWTIKDYLVHSFYFARKETETQGREETFPKLHIQMVTDLGITHGILCSRKKGRTPTLRNTMDATGEHYAKWNKPGGERQISFDLTYKWNLINTTKKWTE